MAFTLTFFFFLVLLHSLIGVSYPLVYFTYAATPLVSYLMSLLVNVLLAFDPVELRYQTIILVLISSSEPLPDGSPPSYNAWSLVHPLS